MNVPKVEMKGGNNKRSSRLWCTLKKEGNDLFFSLVDYRNNYFTSNDPEKIIEFYNGFENRDQLIQWMKERPNGTHTIYEVEGDNDIIVVIPTADYNGKFAKECRENIFKGLYIIFVESGGRGDFYFNYARNCNVGIKKAMEYNPKWVVVSNDDAFKIDDVDALVNGLTKLDNKKYDTVFTLPPSRYHSHRESIGKRNLVRSLFYSTYDSSHRIRKKIEDKYNINYMIRPGKGMSKIMLNNVENIILTQAFGIFSPNFLRKFTNGPYDLVYINNIEEFDLSYELNKEERRLGYINYRVGDYVGTSLGNGKDRWMRSLASEVYFNFKLENRLTPFEKFNPIILDSSP